MRHLRRSRQTVAERVFKRLTEKGPDNRELRRPTKLSRLERIRRSARGHRHGPQPFSREGRSFLLPSLEVELDDESVIDISHESLIRQWGRLRNSVADDQTPARCSTAAQRRSIA